MSTNSRQDDAVGLLQHRRSRREDRVARNEPDGHTEQSRYSTTGCRMLLVLIDVGGSDKAQGIRASSETIATGTAQKILPEGKQELLLL